MPRQKNLPARLSQNFTNVDFTPISDLLNSTNLSPVKKRVSFDIFNTSADYSVKGRKKKLHRTLPKNSIVLGDIHFLIDEYEKILFNLENVNFWILIKEGNDYLELSLKITLETDKNDFALMNLLIPNEKLLSSLKDLVQHQFIWVLGNAEDVFKGKLIISVTTTAEKAPILKAKNLIHLFFDNSPETFQIKHNNKISTTEFYKELQACQKNNLKFVDKDVQHEKLLPQLRPYQARAAKWMLFRESKNLESQRIDWLPSVIKVYKSKCGKTLYYNKYSEVLSVEEYNFSLLPRGGILADEMGLGKTVVVICLILNHNCTLDDHNGDFLLPYVEKGKNDVIECKIVTKVQNDIAAKNKEDCLSVDEKLVYKKVSSGPALKRALTEWYESKLAAYCAATPSKVRKKVNEYSVKCVCGSVSSEENCVQCPECKDLQHSKCVGFEKEFQYFCPPCWTKQKLVKSCGTLIVAPSSIYHQWFDEIKKHVTPDAFKNNVFMYKGVKDEFIQPSVLSQFDIVITTYSILRTEINHVVQDDSERNLRNEKRFLKLCSPIKQIHWWRLCLDEAQMVENDYSQINQMANLISSVNRWSVTGTPIQKTINDLYYLIEWLGIEPYKEKSAWNNLFFIPYINGNKVPLHSIISRIFWRNSKYDVADELIIPKQTIKYHFLKFSAIEQNFYMREHAIISADFNECLRRLRLDVHRTLDSLDKAMLTKLLIPLLNLRQACSHPLAVKGNKISCKTGSMTLSELLLYLYNKTKIECEEGMRKYIAALNGLAGLYCIQEDWPRAVDYYRQVLQFTEEYKEKINIDTLQRIHTLTNLAEILQLNLEIISPTLRDDSLKTSAKILEDKYMQKSIDDLKSNEKSLNELSKKVEELEKKFESSSQTWWNRLLHLLIIDGSFKELTDKLSTELITSEVDSKRKVEIFLSKTSSEKGIEIMLRHWLDSIDVNREKALKQLQALKKLSQDKLVNQAVSCHLRTFGNEKKKSKCPLCTCESTLLDYECTLFDVSRKVLKENYEKVLDGAQTKGSWRMQNAEKCLKVLLNVSKLKNTFEPWCLKDGKTHIQLLEVLKKEFKQIRAVWMSINHKVQASDEISMCKLRLRLRLPEEPIPPKITSLSLKEHNKVETIFIIEQHEVESQKMKLTGELELSKSEFKKKFGTLLYLKNLGQKENPKPEPCPVCKMVLDNEWCVLQCGHSYCIDCIRIMLNRSQSSSLNCPVCRETTKGCDLSFIDLSGKQDNTDIKVLGDHSTKVEGIVRSLLELKKSDPKVKVLIFSTWNVVLKILEVALTQNEISFRRMPGHKYQLHLKDFKDSNLNITVLLLPISWGSKGLNLTEASHVFLVEPILNPAEELQAVGRVHRIGQTKETIVHRFLIRGTIEEKIQAAVTEAKDKWCQKKVTVEDLKNLFDMKNDFVTKQEFHKVMLFARILNQKILFGDLKNKTIMSVKRPSSNITEFREIFKKAKNILVLTGAGVSAESGIPTFRGPGGYWRKYVAQDLATPQAFRANPSLVWEFYHHRREVALSKKPNNAHKAIADCQNHLAEEGRKVWIITQNIDELHQRAGAKEVLELHGSLFKTRCLKCGNVEENRDNPICPALAGKGAPDPKTMSADIPEKDLPRCKKSSCDGLLRPHIVWFGEMLDHAVLSLAEKAVSECDLCLVVGTSSVVYPAAMFAPQVAQRGVPVAEFNIETTPATGDFRFHFDGPCGLSLPAALAL